MTVTTATLVHLHIAGEPVAKGRPRLGKAGNVYTPAATTAAERVIGWAVKAAHPGVEPTALLVGLAVDFRSRVPATQRNGRPDLDNLCKTVQDALNGIVWGDDSQVVELHATLRRGVPDPGTTLRIYLAGEEAEQYGGTTHGTN